LSSQILRGAFLAVALCLVSASSAGAAPTDAPLLIRSVQTSPADYVLLQMTVDGQNDVDGEVLSFYSPNGTDVTTYTIPSDVPNGESQRTILLASSQAAAQPGFPTPDFDLGPANRLDPTGGAVCVSGRYPADCLAWGSFPSIGTPIGASLPNPQHSKRDTGGPAELFGRNVFMGCRTWLDRSDDTDNSDINTLDPDPINPELGGSGPPPPRNNGAPVAETPCPPQTVFNRSPANPTNDTTPTFAFAEAPPEYPGVIFKCSFEGSPFADCDPKGITYGPLADGFYTFEAFAIGQGGLDPSPASWTFEVDTVPPDTIIDSVPPEPSNGFSASFGFHSSEPLSQFQCQFEGGPIQTCEPGKTLFQLADGAHTFRVWAIDQATNVDPTPAVAVFNVDTTLGDRSAPDTTIVNRPPNPSASARATFSYRSNEPRSSFQCRLDDEQFSACDPAGVAYPRLKNGSHTFRVRAVDRAGNLDSAPAMHSWTVKAPLPETKIVVAPPGAQRIKGAGTKSLKVAFAFRASEPKASFRCRIDKRPFVACRSPKKFSVRPGRHRFEVYAVDAVGNVEPTPARRIFRVLPALGSRNGLFRLPRLGRAS